MRSRDDAQAARAAAVRMRAAAPVAAFAFPVALLVLATIARGAWSEDAASALVAVAAPTAALVTVLFEDTPSLPVLLAAMVASGPLWGLLGRFLADRVRDGRWPSFWRLYGFACAAWVAAAAAILVVLG